MPHPDDIAALGVLGEPVPGSRRAAGLPAPRPTTWCSTAGSSARAASGSTAGDVQQRIFELLGIGEEEQQRKFGFLLDAFRYGAPPHAGFAFGIDRLVALLSGEENIREVIAFPKTQSGLDPLTNAPTEIEPAPAHRARPAPPPQGHLSATGHCVSLTDRPPPAGGHASGRPKAQAGPATDRTRLRRYTGSGRA